MVLFVGTLHEGYFAKKIVESREEEFEVIDDVRELQFLIPEVLRTQAQTVILDVSQYADEVKTIVESADRIVEGLNCKLVILAAGLIPGSQLVQAFYNAGYTDFILDSVLTEKKKTLEKCLAGDYEREGAPEEIVKAAEQIKQENPLSKKEEEAALRAIREAQRKKITIGVAGSQHHIGTSTQAVQIAKYFMEKGHATAIVEMNSSGFFQSTADMSEENVIRNDGIRMLVFKGLDIYLDPAQITKFIRQKYDCIVYDYGCYFDQEFEKVSYMERDICCIVCGSKVNEYENTNAALKECMNRDNVYYLFSFISRNEAKDIAKSMKNLADHTMFPAYTPDMFVYDPDNDYERFFKYKLQAERKKEKKGLFRFRRKEES